MIPISIALMGVLGLVQSPQALSLDQALSLAREHRPLVRAAELRVEQARLQRRSLVAPLSPRLSIQATSNRDLVGNDDDLILSQPIDLFGKRKVNRALGDAQIRLAEAALRQTLGEVQGDVVERYSELVAAGLLAKTASAQLELAERLRDATVKRSEGGIVPPIQVKRANIEVERARQNLALRVSAQSAARKRLAGALGVAPETVVAGDFASLAIAPVDAAELARQRPDLLTLSAEFAVSKANVAVGQLPYQPELEISARTSPYSFRNNETGLRATLNFPLFDSDRRRNVARSEKKAEEAHRKSMTDATVRAQVEIEAILIEIAAAEERQKGFENLLADTREVVRVSDVGYQEGATTLLEVLEASRALREIEESLVESRLRVAQARAAYLRATGTLLGGIKP